MSPKVAKASRAVVTNMGIFNGIFMLNFANVNIEFFTKPNVKIIMVKSGTFTLAKFNLKISVKIPMIAKIAVLVLVTL